MKTVLSIGAHPDDIEIGCGGSELILKQQGYRVVHVVATSGEQGSLTTPMADLKKLRTQEAMASGNVLGASDVIFLDLPDGLTSFSLETKITLISIIRRFKPEIVFTHSSSDKFPDHQVVRNLSISAVTAAAGPWYPQAEGEPHKVPKVLGYEVWHPMNEYQTAVNISAVMDQKRLALTCHDSQTGEVDYLAAIEGLALYRGAMSMEGKYAEVFEVIKLMGSI